MSSSDRTTTAPYPVRLPDTLRKQLAASARRESRSLHAEIIARLAASFTEGQAVSGLTAEDLLTRVDRYVASLFEVQEQNQQISERLDEAVNLLSKRHFERD